MKQKGLYLLFLIMLGVSLLTSCSKDDDDNGGGQDTIEINGVKYSLGYVTLMGVWKKEFNGGEFTVSVNNTVNGITTVNYYKFDFENSLSPKVGDDFSKMNLKLYAGDEDSYFYDEPLNYVSGSAKVVGLNKSESSITIKFDQLKMNRGGTNYTFTGTVTLLFTDNW